MEVASVIVQETPTYVQITEEVVRVIIAEPAPLRVVTIGIAGPPGPTGQAAENDPAVQAHLAAPHAPADATANRPDAELLDRSNHTGTQPISTLSDFDTATLNGGYF